MTQSSPADEASDVQSRKSVAVRFTGRTGQFLQIWLVNSALTLVTCGLYFPWATVRTRQYFLGQIRLQGSGFAYQARGWPLFWGWLLLGFAFTLMSSGADALAAVLGKIAGLKSQDLPQIALYVALLAVLQGLLSPWLMILSLRYNASRTSFRNLRFGFGSRREQACLWRELLAQFGLWLLLIPSLGLLYPTTAWHWRRFLIRHRRFGTTPFTFTATPADFWRLHLRAAPLLLIGAALVLVPLLVLSTGAEALQPWGVLVLLLLVPLGLALWLFWLCWLEANAGRLTWRSTGLGELRFHCSWQARELLALRLVNRLVLLLTLGLAWPWVRIRNARYRLERISVSPVGALDGFVAAEQERVSGLAEGAFLADDALGGFFDIGL